MTQHSVLIAGAGPTGLMLAGELALAGVDVALVEKRASQVLAGPRARGLHARSIELLDQRGIADRFVSRGKIHRSATFLDRPVDLSELPSRHNYLLALGQQDVERILADRLRELAVPIYREREVKGFAQDEHGVDVALSDGTALRAAFLVGCDGGRSVVRKTAGIAFPGHDATASWLIAEVEFASEPTWGFHTDARGRHAIGKLDGGRRAGVVLAEAQLKLGDQPSLQELREALIATYGTDFGVHDAKWLSRFTDAVRQAAAYRQARVLIAGDAAHVHPPIGGQGLDLGLQDAVNLGWKLAQVVKGISRSSLLDTYHGERHPAAARVLRNTLAEVALRRPDARTKALGGIVWELLMSAQARRRCAAELSGLAVRHEPGDAHPLVGWRVPDLDLVTLNGPRRVFSLLHDARPVLLVLREHAAFDIAPWKDRVRQVGAGCVGAWELPVVGAVPAPAALLIRPDGHVAWAGDAAQAGLREALSAWFGPPAAA